MEETNSTGPPALDALLSRTLRLGVAALPLALPLALVLHAPETLWELAKGPATEGGGALSSFDPVALLLFAITGQMLPVLVVPALLRRIADRQAALRPDVRGVGRRYLPALATSLVISLPVALLEGAGSKFIHAGATPSAALAIVACVLVVLDQWLGARLAIAVVVALVELRSVPAAIARAWRLTRGHALAIFGAQLLLGVASMVFGFLLRSAFESRGVTHAGEWGFGLAGAALTPFYMALQALLYDDLRRTGDGVDSAVIVAELA
jgi:hypothetical protein